MTSLPATTASRTAWSGVGALADALDVTVSIGLGPGADADGPHLVVVDGGVLHATTAAGLLGVAAAGHRVVVAASPGTDLTALGVTLGDRPLGRPSADDPLVVDTRVTARGTGALAGLAVEADDVTGVTVGDGHPLLVHRGDVVAVRLAIGPGTLDVIGSAAWLRNRWLSAADNAATLARLLGHDPTDGPTDGRASDPAVAAVVTHTPQPPTPHGPLPTVVTEPAELIRWYLSYDPSDPVELAVWRSLLAAIHAVDDGLAQAISDAFVRFTRPLAVLDPFLAEQVRLIGDGLYLNALVGAPPPSPEHLERIIVDLTERLGR